MGEFQQRMALNWLFSVQMGLKIDVVIFILNLILPVASNLNDQAILLPGSPGLWPKPAHIRIEISRIVFVGFGVFEWPALLVVASAWTQAKYLI
jgi:hypothetical protein